MSTSVELSPDVFGKLAQDYELRDPERVRAWLTEYPFLVPILLGLRPEITHLFPDATVALKVEDDPEIDHSQLLARIYADIKDVNILGDRLDTLNEFFWRNETDVSQGKLLLMPEWK